MMEESHTVPRGSTAAPRDVPQVPPPWGGEDSAILGLIPHHEGTAGWSWAPLPLPPPLVWHEAAGSARLPVAVVPFWGQTHAVKTPRGAGGHNQAARPSGAEKEGFGGGTFEFLR